MCVREAGELKGSAIAPNFHLYFEYINVHMPHSLLADANDEHKKRYS